MEVDDNKSSVDSMSTTSSSAVLGENLVSPLPADGYVPPHKLLPHIINNERRLLPRILYTLTTGFLEYELSEHNHAMDRSKIPASYAASDLILRAADPKQVGFFTRTVDFLLEHGTDTETREILSMFRASTSRQYSRIKHFKPTTFCKSTKTGYSWTRMI
jgi:hypothetical protein